MNFRYILKKFDLPFHHHRKTQVINLQVETKIDKFYHFTYKTMIYKRSDIIEGELFRNDSKITAENIVVEHMFV